ncbi:MAG TPA: NADH-quinone oxidoreductase subunit NuoH [Acidimicrobiales bacterium]|nr:NADH-quinone oxidoreductase subunit NuoH [Acidimicrobiales bacterium]
MRLLAAGDPLLDGHVDWGDVAVVLIKVGVTFAALLVAVMLMIWYERKLIADMQNRIGPNRAGPFGMLQTLADGIKLFFKEDLIPERADRRVFKLAPYLSIVPAFLAFSIVPIGGVVEIFGKHTRLQLADPPIGILLLLAMSSVSVYGVMLAGWSSGSKYPLLGSVRASAQMVSYEAALGLSVAAVVLVTGSLSITDIVAGQSEGFLSWNLVRLGVVPFAVFLIAATAELNRPPFDLTEAEQELVGGFHTEYSSIRFAMFFLAEFMNTITMSAIIVTLFLGGPGNPLGTANPSFLPWLWPIVWFLLKTILFLSVFVWFRATLPRLRYDQLMDLGWKWLIPLSLVWLLLLAAVLIGGDRQDRLARLGIALTLALLVGAAISRAVQVGRERQDARDEVNV